MEELGAAGWDVAHCISQARWGLPVTAALGKWEQKMGV